MRAIGPVTGIYIVEKYELLVELDDMANWAKSLVLAGATESYSAAPSEVGFDHVGHRFGNALHRSR